MNVALLLLTLGPALLVYLGPRLYLWLTTKPGVLYSDLLKKHPELQPFKTYYVGGHFAVVVLGSLLLVGVGWLFANRQVAEALAGLPAELVLGLLSSLIVLSLALLTGWCAWRFGIYPISTWSHNEVLLAYRPQNNRIQHLGLGQMLVSELLLVGIVGYLALTLL
jgi:hypothetical protein